MKIFHLTVLLFTSTAIIPAAAHNDFPPTALSFAEFKLGLAQSRYEDYAGKPGVQVASSTAFAEMRRYLQDYYNGITPSHSFWTGKTWVDCVPLMQQPSVRAMGISHLASPPPPETSLGDLGGSHDGVLPSEPNADSAKLDRFGNVERCEHGTAPVRRLTLERMVHFPTLRAFLQKEPDNADHDYAVAYQNVDNWGGNAALNLWNTAVDTGLNESFTLAQHWYVGGSDAQTQTAETGWINYPDKFEDQPVLFVYWTANNYGRGGGDPIGCYNLECKGFVQTNNQWCLGCSFPHYSSTGGKQFDVELGYYLYQGNWWLKVGRHRWRTHQDEWLGYLPTAVYEGGQMAEHAQEIEYGGETAVHSTHWPCMGSCHFAETGFGSAAYVRRIVYRGDPSDQRYTPDLSLYQPEPQCYTATDPTHESDVYWKTNFYFGGPGGESC